MLSEQVRLVLEPLVGDELDGLYQRWRSARPHAHISLFVRDLLEQHWIGQDQVLDLALAVERAIHLPASPEVHDLDGRLDPLSEVDRGGQGEILLAHDPVLARNVAYKRMHPTVARKPDAVRRFLNEALITAQLDHPGIVPVYTLERTADRAFAYSMKMIRGRQLAAVIRTARQDHEAGGWPDEEHDLPARLALFLQVCSAIHYAHERGVIHRDLKPGNIMVGPHDDVVVMDWGLAKVLGSNEVWDPTSTFDENTMSSGGTAAGAVLGTPQYMSPEQALGMIDSLDEKSDQYALGLILFELVTLRVAYPGKIVNVQLMRAREGQLAPLEHIDPSERIPRELRGIIRRATAQLPDERYPSVRELARDVRRYLRDDPVKAAPDGLLQALQRRVARNRGMVLAALMSLLLMLTVGAFAAVVGTVVVGDLRRRAAQAREDALTDLVGAATFQAQQIDVRFLRTESLLEGVAGQAATALQVPAEPVDVYTSAQFDDGRTRPREAIEVPHYADPVTWSHPVFKLAPGVEQADVAAQMHQLAAVRPAMYRALLKSYGDDTPSRSRLQQRNALLGRPTPVIWVFLSTVEGVHVKLPGKGGYHDDFDGRKREWYRLAQDVHHPVWGATYADSDETQLLIPCSLSVRDDDGQLLGVAGIDLSVEAVIDELLEPDVDEPVDTYVVDGRGRIVVSNRYHGKSAVDRLTASFPYFDALQAKRGEGHVGHFELVDMNDDKLIVWADLDVMDWTYVVVGRTEDILH